MRCREVGESVRLCSGRPPKTYSNISGVSISLRALIPRWASVAGCRLPPSTRGTPQTPTKLHPFSARRTIRSNDTTRLRQSVPARSHRRRLQASACAPARGDDHGGFLVRHAATTTARRGAGSAAELYRKGSRRCRSRRSVAAVTCRTPFQILQLKPHDVRHGVAMEMYGEHGDLEKVRALLGHQRIDTPQIYASIRPTQLKRSSWRQRRVGC
jgi:hypothetical protein